MTVEIRTPLTADEEWLRVEGLPDFPPRAATVVVAIVLTLVLCTAGLLLRVPARASVMVSDAGGGAIIVESERPLPAGGEARIEWTGGFVIARIEEGRVTASGGRAETRLTVIQREGSIPSWPTLGVLDPGSSTVLATLWNRAAP